jgi:hypothetical protein
MIIFDAAMAAFLSACCRRLRRSESEYTLSTFPMEDPYFSDWIMLEASVRNSSTPVRL